MRKTLLILLLLLLSCFSLIAEQYAVIAYIEGWVDVARDGYYLDPYEVDIGMELTDYDLIETGYDGYVELELYSPVSPRITLKIGENTSFYFTYEESGSSKKATGNLLAGSVGIRVDKLLSNADFEMRNNTVVLGVRGTTYEVTASPDKATLVTCDEGRVSVTSEDTKGEYYSYPGRITEYDRDKGLKNLALAVEDYEEFTDKWVTMRYEFFKSNAKVFSEYYVSQFVTHLGKFAPAYKNLENLDHLFAKWLEYEQNGVDPSAAEAIQDKMVIANDLVTLRSIFPRMQEIIYSISELNRLYQDAPFSGSAGGMSFSSFFASFNKSEKKLKGQLNKSRLYFKIFDMMNKYSFGGEDELGEDPDFMDDFFADPMGGDF